MALVARIVPTQLFFRAMGKQRSKARDHFVRCVETVEGRSPVVKWKCDHCNKVVFQSQKFRANIARIHLAAQDTNGQCALLCDATDEKAKERQEYFRQEVEEARQKSAEKQKKRKQSDARLAAREKLAADNAVLKKKKQTTLFDVTKLVDAEAADVAVSEWAIAHDIPANALRGPYWKRLNKKLSSVSPSYIPMNPQKLTKTMLPKLKTMAIKEQQDILKHDPRVGRTLTGDGATKQVPLINFLAHVPGKGVTLLSVEDCSGHMAEGGVKNAL